MFNVGETSPCVTHTAPAPHPPCPCLTWARCSRPCHTQACMHTDSPTCASPMDDHRPIPWPPTDIHSPPTAVPHAPHCHPTCAPLPSHTRPTAIPHMPHCHPTHAPLPSH